MLLSQVHRLRALDLLGRFLDLGPWAVSLVRAFSLPWGSGLGRAESRLCVTVWGLCNGLDAACVVWDDPLPGNCPHACVALSGQSAGATVFSLPSFHLMLDLAFARNKAQLVGCFLCSGSALCLGALSSESRHLMRCFSLRRTLQPHPLSLHYY